MSFDDKGIQYAGLAPDNALTLFTDPAGTSDFSAAANAGGTPKPAGAQNGQGTLADAASPTTPFAQTLASLESQGQPNNGYGGWLQDGQGIGAIGRYGMRQISLESIGWMDKAGNWTDAAKANSVDSPESFRDNPTAQEAARTAYMGQLKTELKSNGAWALVGQTLEGQVVTEAGIIAAAWKEGSGAVAKLIDGSSTNVNADKNIFGRLAKFEGTDLVAGATQIAIDYTPKITRSPDGTIETAYTAKADSADGSIKRGDYVVEVASKEGEITLRNVTHKADNSQEIYSNEGGKETYDRWNGKGTRTDSVVKDSAGTRGFTRDSEEFLPQDPMGSGTAGGIGAATPAEPSIPSNALTGSKALAPAPTPKRITTPSTPLDDQDPSNASSAKSVNGLDKASDEVIPPTAGEQNEAAKVGLFANPTVPNPPADDKVDDTRNEYDKQSDTYTPPKTESDSAFLQNEPQNNNLPNDGTFNTNTNNLPKYTLGTGTTGSGINLASAGGGTMTDAGLMGIGGGTGNSPQSTPSLASQLTDTTLSPQQQTALATQLTQAGLNTADLTLVPLSGGGYLIANSEGDVVGSTQTAAGQFGTGSDNWTQITVGDHVSYLNPVTGANLNPAQFAQTQQATLTQNLGQIGVINSLQSLANWDQMSDLGKTQALAGFINNLGTASGAGSIQGLGQLGAALSLYSALQSDKIEVQIIGLANFANMNGLVDNALNAAMGNAAGSAAADAVPYLAIANALSNLESNPGQAIGQMVGMYFGGSLGGALGGLIGGALGGMFGGHSDPPPPPVGIAALGWGDDGELRVNIEFNQSGAGSNASAMAKNVQAMLEQITEQVNAKNPDTPEGHLKDIAINPYCVPRFGVDRSGAWMETVQVDGSTFREHIQNETFQTRLIDILQQNGGLAPAWQVETIKEHYQAEAQNNPEEARTHASAGAGGQSRAGNQAHALEGQAAEASDFKTQTFGVLAAWKAGASPNIWGLTPKESQTPQNTNQGTKGSDPNWLGRVVLERMPARPMAARVAGWGGWEASNDGVWRLVA